MPGSPLKKLRRKQREASELAARLTAAGDPEAPKAVEEAARLAGLLKDLESGRLLPADPNKRGQDQIVVIREVKEIVRNKAAEAEARGPKPEKMPYYPVADLVPAPEALTDTEFGRAACVVAAVMEGGSPYEGLESPDAFLANAFPMLNPGDRVRAARYLSALSAAELRAKDGRPAATDCALSAAGIPYAAFEAMRKREKGFDEACDLVEKARRRALMSMLEENLLERAFDGYEEEALNRSGDVVKLLKFDNRLGFEILRYSHEHYVRVGSGKAAKGTKGDGGGGGMTLMIANNLAQATEPAPKRTPKTVEAVPRA